jgi:uncharacterized protein YceH (UPF0502 family)
MLRIDMNESKPLNETAERRWRPLDRFERRVAGVLVEKAKTTPDAYPMTLNAITTACNQKSNRSPVMDLSQDTVLETLDRLRGKGAVVEVHGDGRVARYKHLLYEWFGVSKAELAVLCELMLRGHQTLGDLRARAARMEPLPTQEDLRPVVQSLLEKSLMMELTPAGRGQIVSHHLYLPEEMEKVRRQVAEQGHSSADSVQDRGESSEDAAESTFSAGSHGSDRIGELERQLSAAIERISRLEQFMDSLK